MSDFKTVEPIFHCFDDCFPDDHKLAWETLYCVNCKEMVHAGNNETMRAWFETGIGPLCLSCFWQSYRLQYVQLQAFHLICPIDTAPDFDSLEMSADDDE